MAIERHSDSDGSDIFWPGYVDAVTNLVLNLLFLLTIMTVAVFMFALELGRASKGGPSQPAANVVAAPTADPARENVELKREIQRLQAMLAQKNGRSDLPAKTVEVTSSVPLPSSGLDAAQARGAEVVVRFTNEAVAFTPEEQARLLASLKPVAAGGVARIVVEVPRGFSEAKRMGYYRAMAVRNLLLEMNLPKEQIDVAVLEGNAQANAAVVKVRSH